MSRARNSVVAFEGLESRQFLSASSHVPVADDAQLVGDWSGKLKATVAGVVHKSYSFTMDVTSQSSTHLHLSIKIAGHTFNGIVPVHFEGGGHVVKYKFDKDGLEGTFKLWVSTDNKSLKANFSGSGDGVPGSGSIKATKEA
jgi:hypothetical protein